MMEKASTYAPAFLSVLRIIAGFLFIQHGVQKVFGLLGSKGMPPLASQMGVGGILELVGGALLILGLFTRFTAFILSGMMAVAYFQAHSPKGFWTIMNGGELAVLYCFLFLYLMAAGGGPWSLDALIWRRVPTTPKNSLT